jgi:hypothetical protein
MPIPVVLVTSATDLMKSSLGTLIRRAMRSTKGDKRALLEELKHNQSCCRLVLEKGVAAETAIPHFQSQVYDRLLQSDFDFNSLSRARIRLGSTEIAQLGSYQGQRTAVLVERIYDRIKDMKRICVVAKDNPQVRWNVRMKSLDSRMKLLWRLLGKH